MKKGTQLKEVVVLDTGQKGKAMVRHNGEVIWLEKVVPGDVVDLTVTSRQKRQNQARMDRLVQASEDRIRPFCRHFDHCGGCKWQNIAYSAQLRQKAKWVADCFQRIGQLAFPEPMPIIGNTQQRHYRNKLDFACSSKRWLTPAEIAGDVHYDARAIGFHVSGHFDKVLNIEECHLMPAPMNAIRNGLRDFAREKGIPFYDPKVHEGFFRGLVLRCNQEGAWMVMVVVAYEARQWLEAMTQYLLAHFSGTISSLFHVFNPKPNDALFDCEHRLIYGPGTICETVNGITLELGPLSFAQTNTPQSEVLYREAIRLAAFGREDYVLDLYTGVGAIALQIAPHVGRVLGVETVPEAVEMARRNARRNHLGHVRFECAQVEKVLKPAYFERRGMPDVIVVDPPRSGIHPKVMKTIAESSVPKLLYISCNPATQARDIALLDGRYSIEAMQPVDMFPHTPHVENIALLTRTNA